MKKVIDYTYRDITTVNEDVTLRRALRTMKLHRVSLLPVENHLGEYLGCISEKQILNAAIPAYMKSIMNTSFMANLGQVIIHLKDILDHKVAEFMDVAYPTVSPDDTMSYAADILYRSMHSIMPVICDKRVLGLISRIEILAVSLDED